MIEPNLNSTTTCSDEISSESATIEELVLSPKAWTRKGQQEIAAMKRAMKAKEGLKAEMEKVSALMLVASIISCLHGWLLPFDNVSHQGQEALKAEAEAV